MTTLHPVPLACGHTRRVVDGIRRMIDAGHIATQSCLTCRVERPLSWWHNHAQQVARLMGW